MNNSQFMEARAEFHELMTKRFAEKCVKYDTTDDRFAHFKRCAAVEGKAPIEALLSMAVKHEISLQDMAKAVSDGRTFSAKEWLESLGDLRNYCDLAYGLLVAEGDI